MTVRKHRTVTITSSLRVIAALDRLRETGLFGRTRAQVAERFVCEGVRQAQRDGWLPDDEMPLRTVRRRRP